MPNESHSLFHLALLEFLRSEVKQRQKKEGYYPEEDASFACLQKALFQSQASGKLPLDEIITQYHLLFHERGPIHLERRLFQRLSKRSFQQAALLDAYPKIYRGLPRVYKRNAPREGRLKEGFADFPALLELSCEKALLKAQPLTDVRGKLTLFTWVMADGFGDFWCAVETIALLRQTFPDLKIEWVALLPKNLAALASHPDLTFSQVYEERSPPMSLSIQDCLKKADFILQIPTYYPETEKLFAPFNKRHFASIGQYGFVEASFFSPASHNRSMGLHFLEKGVLIRKAPKKLGFEALQSELLRRWLAEKKEAKFTLAYLCHSVGGWIYFQALLKSIEEDPQDLDICSPQLDWFIGRLKNGLPPLADLSGVKCIEVRLVNETFSIPLQEKGKTVRLLAPGPLSHDDFTIALGASQLCVAVRGDQSFSEAIGAGIPFYYDARDHARFFLKDLTCLVENRIGAYPSSAQVFKIAMKASLYTLPEETEDWVDETYFQEKQDPFELALELAQVLKGADLAEGFQTLSRILAEEHSFANFLCPFIARQLWFAKKPEEEVFFKRHMALFAQGKYSFAELARHLKGRYIHK